MVALDEFTLATYYVGTVNVWDMRTNSRVFTKEYAEPSELANSAALPSNRLAVFGSGMVVVWDWSTGHQVCELYVKHVKCVAGFGSETLVVGVHNLLRVYKDGQLVLKRRGHDRNIRQLLALSSNLLASGGQDANIRIWNVESLQCLHVFSGVKWGTMDLLGDGSLVTVSLDGHHVLVYRDGLLVHDLAYFGSPMVALKAMSKQQVGVLPHVRRRVRVALICRKWHDIKKKFAWGVPAFFYIFFCVIPKMTPKFQLFFQKKRCRLAADPAIPPRLGHPRVKIFHVRQAALTSLRSAKQPSTKRRALTNNG